MAYYPDWHLTPRSAITCEDGVRTVDRLEVHRIVESTLCGGLFDQAALVAFPARLKGGFQVPDALSVDQIMACNR